MITVNSQGIAAREEEWGIINPAMKRHFELEIERETLQNAPRDESRLRELLKLKEKENGQATHIEDTLKFITKEQSDVVKYAISDLPCLWSFTIYSMQ